MKFNVGTNDRLVRIIVGYNLIALAATSTIGWWGWIGVVPLLTGIFKYCPAYALFHFSTRPAEEPAKKEEPPAEDHTPHGLPG